MRDRGAKLRTVAFVLLTGALAVVLIAALLLFGVEPRLVFAPGFIVMSWGKALGFQVPKQVGVVSTALFCWAVIVAVRFAVVGVIKRRA